MLLALDLETTGKGLDEWIVLILRPWLGRDGVALLYKVQYRFQDRSGSADVELADPS